MKPALLLIDLQHDFLNRPGLVPPQGQTVAAAAGVLAQCRAAGLPVLHIHTQIRPDGSDAMPHWRERGYLACVAGTPGELSPPELAPQAGETLIRKRFFSGFENPALLQQLRGQGIDTVILAGIYLHGCVRATALDAYANGYRVLIAEQAVASTEALHAEISREYLEGRAARFLDNATLFSLINPQPLIPGPDQAYPSAIIAGLSRHGSQTRILRHQSPVDSRQTLSGIAPASQQLVAEAAAAARNAQTGWSQTGLEQRRTWLNRWRQVLAAQEADFLELMVQEVGKPLADSREEFHRTLAVLDVAQALAIDCEAIQPGVTVRHRPVGVIGLITPWNNPLAIAAGKIAPALVYGNGVVWKPSPHASKTAELLLATLAETGLPAGLVNLLHGDAETARHLMREPGIDAISLTGSNQAGHSAAMLCAIAGKPLQAELGGNNAVIVLADAGLDQLMPALAKSAFSFAGQRCTAIRRFIVAKPMLADFEQALSAAASALRIGHPADPATDIGPLISRQHLESIENQLRQALAQGARLLCGGKRPPHLPHGCWLQPAVLSGAHPEAAIVQQESFGPLAVIQPADDLDQAIALANAVPHGLVAGLISNDQTAQALFLQYIQAGIVKLGPGPLCIDPHAPFGGWKASRIGPPEHGVWNRQFYSKPQVVYG